MRNNSMRKRILGLRPALMCLAVLLCLNPGRVGAAQNLPASFSSLVKKAAPGVVNIMATKVIKPSSRELSPFEPGDPFRDFFDRYFGNRMPREYRQGTLGTGFLIDAKGMILTNNHVVEDSIDLKVKLADNSEFRAQIVGRDPKTDLALIRIDTGKPLPALALGDSDALEVGDWVVAIGNPFGLGNTVTSGIVSAKYRQIGAGVYDNFIQTDAAINPGNSGGPLLNLKGEVIGINSAIFSQSGGSVGIGFAIPTNMVQELLPQLRQGKVRRSFLGVMVQDVTPELKQKLKLDTGSGALVSDVVPGGPADKAGIRRGDVIVSFDGKPVPNARDLPLMVASAPIGRRAEIEILRRGRKISLHAVTEEMQEEEPPPSEPTEEIQKLGLTLQTLTPETAEKLGVERTLGLLVVQVDQGSPAAMAGLQPEDIIIEVDQQPVTNTADFERLAAANEKGTSLLLLVDRDGSTIFMTLAQS
ncbi:MAG: DegQ family serine endoprotease [Desulfosarcinaceae bacterium]